MLLALDIGTEFVKSVIFSVDPVTKKVNIKGFGKSRQHSNAMQGAMIVNIENVINACDRSIGAALTQSDKIESRRIGNEEYRTPLPTKVVMGIAGELVRGITIMADYSREDTDEKIEQEEVDEVVKSIKEQAFADAVADIADEIGLASDQLEEISSRVNSTYIDGVKVDNPLGFTGKNVSYKIYSTFAPSIHINSLKEIASELGLEVISIEVEPYAVARAMKGGRSKSFSAIFIDVGGGTSDVAVVDRGAIMGTKMFAYGGRVFTKRIAHDLNLDLNLAEEMKIEYSKGVASDEQRKKIAKALGTDKIVWVEGVELALSEMEDVESYPTTFYLCGGGSALPEIKDALLQHPWLQVLPFLKYPKVEFLFPSQLEDIHDETEEAINPEDITPLALARMVLE